MKTPSLSFLLASTAMVVVASTAGAQMTRQAEALKPSVEVHLEALDSLKTSANVAAPQAMPVSPPVQVPNAVPTRAAPVVVPAQQPQTLDTNNNAVISSQTRIIPLSGARQPEVRKLINQNSTTEKSDRDIPRHGSSVLLNSRLMPLAPAPAGNIRPIPKQPPQMMHIVPPYGAAKQVAPVEAMPAPVEAQQAVGAPAQNESPFQYAAPASQAPAPVEAVPVEIPMQAAAVEAQPVEMPEAAMAEIEAPAPVTVVEKKDESSWWDDTTDTIGSIFEKDDAAETSQADSNVSVPNVDTEMVAESAPKSASNIANAENTLADVQEAGEQPLSAPPAKIQSAVENERRKPVNQDLKLVAEAAPEPAAAPESAPETPAQNAASYDGMEMAEGFSAHMPDMSLSAPPAALMQPAAPAEVPLPVPVVREGEEVVLAQASDDGAPAGGLVDPFADGSSFAIQHAKPQPIAPIVAAAPEPAPVAQEIAATPENPPIEAKPETNIASQAAAPEMQAPAESVPAIVATPAKEDSSWMSDLQNSLTGYFADEEVAPAPQPATPLVSKEDELKIDELRAVPTEPVVVSALPDTDPAPVVAPVDEATRKTVDTMVGLGELKPMPENPEVSAPAEIVVANANAEATPLPKLPTSDDVATNNVPSQVNADINPKDLPSLTKLAGDPKVIRETEKRHVASGELPPLPADRKPIPQRVPDKAQNNAAEHDVPAGNPPISAEQLVKDVPIILSKPMVSTTPAPQAPEVMVSAKAPEVKVADAKEAAKAAPKAEIKPVEKTVEKLAAKKEVPATAEAVKEAKVEADKKPNAKANNAATASDTKADEKAKAGVPTEATASAADDTNPPAALKSDDVKAVASLAEKEKIPAVAPMAANASLNFTVDSKALPSGSESQLKPISEVLKNKENARVTLKAYATAEDDAKAKRVALSRGLAVRNYLIDQGVNPLRINLMPLGNKGSGGNPERVDVELVTVGGV